MSEMSARLEIASRIYARARTTPCCTVREKEAVEMADALIAEEARTRQAAADTPGPAPAYVWVPYSKDLFAQQQLPAERRSVLLMLPELKKEGVPPSVVVGYLRYAAGDENSPYFVMPGASGGRQPTHWCDCLGDNFRAPLWHGVGQHGRDATPAPDDLRAVAEAVTWAIDRALLYGDFDHSDHAREISAACRTALARARAMGLGGGK